MPSVDCCSSFVSSTARANGFMPCMGNLGHAFSGKFTRMIGVASRLSEQEIVREFFELFKTEWEFEQPGVDYEVVIRCAGDFGEKSNAKLVIFYGADSGATSSLPNVRAVCRGNRTLLFNKDR